MVPSGMPVGVPASAAERDSPASDTAGIPSPNNDQGAPAMNRRICKYELKVFDTASVTVDGCWARALSAQIQDGKICLWVEVDASPTDHVYLDVFIVGTGNPMNQLPTDMRFVDTVQSGSLVWHVFVKGESA